MATYTDATKVSGDWLKWEEDGWFSRENAPLVAGSGALQSGTVLKLAGGKVSPMLTGEGGSAFGLLLHAQANSVVDKPVAIITRDAVVTDKGIVWAAGVLTADKTAATTTLQGRGIQIRQAV